MISFLPSYSSKMDLFIFLLTVFIHFWHSRAVKKFTGPPAAQTHIFWCLWICAFDCENVQKWNQFCFKIKTTSPFFKVLHWDFLQCFIFSPYIAVHMPISNQISFSCLPLSQPVFCLQSHIALCYTDHVGKRESVLGVCILNTAITV